MDTMRGLVGLNVVKTERIQANISFCGIIFSGRIIIYP